jgi:hypothetical protein
MISVRSSRSSANAFIEKRFTVDSAIASSSGCAVLNDEEATPRWAAFITPGPPAEQAGNTREQDRSQGKRQLCRQARRVVHRGRP